jgi:hypothetical protein
VRDGLLLVVREKQVPRFARNDTYFFGMTRIIFARDDKDYFFGMTNPFSSGGTIRIKGSYGYRRLAKEN